MENGDYVVAIDLGTNTVATVVGTRAEGGKVRIVEALRMSNWFPKVSNRI